MATWEDGPEYAPLDRPDAFDEPSAGSVGLEVPPPPPQAPAAPTQRPAFADPTQTLPALADLVPQPPVRRDPEQPFDVTSSTITAESSAWASAHWAPPQSIQPGQLSQPPQLSAPTLSQPPQLSQPTHVSHPTNGQRPPVAPAFPPPNGSAPSFPPPQGGPAYPAPYPVASGPAVSSSQPFPPPGYPPVSGPFPAPGTPQWFAPGSYQPQAPLPPTPSARAVLAAATPGVLITLVVGGLIWVLAPVTVILAFLLTSRMTYGRKPTRSAFTAAVGILVGVGGLTAAIVTGGFSPWWDVVAGWACFASWVMLLATVINVYRALKQGRPDPPPTPRASLR